MKKLLNIIITIIIRFQSYYFKPEDKFSEIIKIEELFIETSLKLLKNIVQVILKIKTPLIKLFLLN